MPRGRRAGAGGDLADDLLDRFGELLARSLRHGLEFGATLLRVFFLRPLVPGVICDLGQGVDEDITEHTASNAVQYGFADRLEQNKWGPHESNRMIDGS